MEWRKIRQGGDRWNGDEIRMERRWDRNGIECGDGRWNGIGMEEWNGIGMEWDRNGIKAELCIPT